MYISYSQNFEDILLHRVFKNIDQGFYIDVGAWHPSLDSVTKLFYDRGWHGINIEPSREYFAKLKNSRTRDTNLNVAVSHLNGQLTYTEVKGSGLSGLDATVIDGARRHKLSYAQYSVPTMTLQSIVDKYVGNQTVAFLKVDVEGHESEVLSSADWSTFRPIIVLVEAVDAITNAPAWDKWESQLLNAKYKFVWFDGLNRFYLREESWLDLNVFFTTPPNILDGVSLSRRHQWITTRFMIFKTGLQRLLPQKCYKFLRSIWQRRFRKLIE
jgi:FkbM family methyltransferase